MPPRASPGVWLARADAVSCPTFLPASAPRGKVHGPVLPAWADWVMVALPLAVVFAGWAVNQHLDCRFVQAQVAIATGALVATAVLSAAWSRWPENVLQAAALASLAAPLAAYLALRGI